ncbi:MAG: efflux transporter outer membrane subunit [Deltaproteobacteria bacterium]|nr:efflux transporter outer membrane subunit [Deltaproteobacteria bacterium]
MRNQLSLAFVLCGVASGCAVGPDFVTPPPPTQTEWINMQDPKHGLTESDAVPQRWWQEFQDPLLSALVERGIESNLDLKIAVERVRQARSQRSVAAAAFYPSVNFEADARRSGSSSNQGEIVDGSVTSGGGRVANFYEAGFDAIWELDIFGGNRRAYEAAGAQLASAQSDQANVLITVAGDIGSGYVTMRGLQQRIAITEATLETQRRAASIAEKRVRAGFSNALDLANASTQVYLTESEIPQLQALLAAQKYSLAVLLGLAPKDLPEQLSSVEPLPQLPAHIHVDAPLSLLRRRPDIRRAEADLHAATALVGVAIADLFPNFSLSAFIGLQGDKESALTTWHDRLWNVAGSVTAPVFQGGRLWANVEIQKSVRDAALFEYEKTVLAALAEVETALVQYMSDRKRAEVLKQAVATSQKALDLSMHLYSEGLSEFINVLDSERSHYASQQSLIQSQQAALLDIIALYKALGGGWEVGPQPT